MLSVAAGSNSEDPPSAASFFVVGGGALQAGEGRGTCCLASLTAHGHADRHESL